MTADDQAAGGEVQLDDLFVDHGALVAEAERRARAHLDAATRAGHRGLMLDVLLAEYDRRAQEIATLRGEKPHAAAVIDRFKEQAAQIAAVRALHCLDEEMSAATGRDCCKGCATSVTHSRWPCKTIAALDAPPEGPLVSPKQSQTPPVSPREDETPEPAPADDETFKCPACGHDADHSGGRCMWIDDYLRNGEHVQEACQCTAGPTLVALCDNVDFDTGDSCTGRLRFTWGQSEAPCDTCRGRCGIAVARWERVEPPAGSVSTTPDPAAQQIAAAEGAVVRAAIQCAVSGHSFTDSTTAQLRDAVRRYRAALAGTATPEPSTSGSGIDFSPGPHDSLSLSRSPGAVNATCKCGVWTTVQNDAQARKWWDQHKAAQVHYDPDSRLVVLRARDLVEGQDETQVVVDESPLLGTWADPEFRAHQDHKHPVEGCGYCPTEDEEGAR